jgi:bacillithiol biosynthesis cysteine-adding enzyme BshC
LIDPTKALGFSDLYLDFLAGQASARHLFVSSGFQQTAKQIDSFTYHREKLVSVLTRQNREYGASDKTFASIEMLRKQATVCYFAGQQAGLFGGPLFSLIKALATVKAAKRRSEELGRPVVPVFWIASDDHDFAEVNHTFVLNREGDINKIEYSVAPAEPVPVGQIQMDNAEAVAAMHMRLHEALGTSDFTSELYSLLQDSYAPGANFVTAFGKLIAQLTADHGLILFSPADAEAKRLAAPLFRAIIERQAELHDILNSTNRRIEQAQYHLQVEKNDQSMHLFYHQQGRWPIVRHGDSYRAGGSSFTHQELQTTIESFPERFSPDVLTRPLMQSYLFPTLAQMGGPSEIAYFAQVNPLFELFGLPVPVHTARPTATIVEKRHEKLMMEHAISFEDLTGDFEQVINRVMAKSFPQDIEREFQNLRTDLFGRFDHFSDKSLHFDPTLREFAQQTAGKIDFLMKAYEAKVFSAHKKRSKETRDRLYRLWHALYPNRAMQDRSLNVSYFIAKHGFPVVSFLYERLDPDQSAHQLISISEYTT